MKTETIHLSQIQVNGANPRIIKNDKFEKLIRSILILPKMLELRPIVVDNTFTVLGGNMRLRALSAIAEMSPAEINTRLGECSGYAQKTEAERDLLRSHWEKWLDRPTAHVIKASELTDAEQREFIIKDNVGYGEWDMDAPANEWDTEHHFSPQGYTALWLLSESHFAVHTFPEFGRTYIELSSCNLDFYLNFLSMTKEL